jgi:peptide deformylase
MYPSQHMRRLGVIQSDDPMLRQPTEPFDMPVEAAAAQRLVVRLLTTMRRISEVHVFGKGMGLAAPQIGFGRAVTVVRPAGRMADPIVLINPEVVSESEESDEQYEGCLSFFDVRGLVPRPLAIEVAHTALNGQRMVSHFERALARLVGHEIDHLNGRLYVDRMRPGVQPIGIEEYRGTGTTWQY